MDWPGLTTVPLVGVELTSPTSMQTVVARMNCFILPSIVRCVVLLNCVNDALEL